MGAGSQVFRSVKSGAPVVEINPKASKPLSPLGKAFGDLRVRHKLMILHNLFFLVLSSAVYVAVSTEAVGRSRWALAAALAVVYVLAVVLLEAVIIPTYVHRPLRLMLAADEAIQTGDREHELIDPTMIGSDEIGQIMRSRNATVSELRNRETDLAQALATVERIAEDLKRKNELLETAKKSLADQDRLASLGLLSASVTHELNTPLAVLHGSIEKLLETVEDPASQQRLARMLRVTERLRKISTSLLDFARAPRQPVQPVELRRVIAEAWSLVSIDDKAAQVRFRDETSASHLVTGDPDRLVQVFVNLLRNALHAVQSSGNIVVHSRRFSTSGLGWIAVDVDDDGPGIPADVLPQIFEAFVTSRLDARGTGLGLTVAAGIVQQHGGAIEASNRPGGGARLEVRLPALVETRARGEA
jgi:signal transduction histidine kinase